LLIVATNEHRGSAVWKLRVHHVNVAYAAPRLDESRASCGSLKLFEQRIIAIGEKLEHAIDRGRVGNADAKAEADICFLIAGGWALASIAYVAITSVKRSYSLKMVSAMIRPDMLNVLVDVLKDEDLILGMTVTKVRGFGRQKGHLDKDAEPINDKISFVPKVRVDLVVNDWDVPSIMEIIQDTLFTGGVGDGKIFVFDAVDAMRVSTGEKGVLAV